MRPFHIPDPVILKSFSYSLWMLVSSYVEDIIDERTLRKRGLDLLMKMDRADTMLPLEKQKSPKESK